MAVLTDKQIEDLNKISPAAWEIGLGTYLEQALSGSPSFVDVTTTGDTTLGDTSADTLTVNATSTFSAPVYINPTLTADQSMTPIGIAYNYAGATNTGSDIDMFSLRSAITQTSSNAKALGSRGYVQGIRSDVTMDGYLDTCYGLYSKATVAGDSSVNGLYGLTAVMTLGSYTISLDESGFIAGIMTSVSGSGDVTCAGTGYGKVAGVYVAWQDTNALTVDSCGFHLGVHAGSLLDSGYRVNTSGTLTNAFHSMNTSGTPTNGLHLEGAHTFALKVPAAATAPVTSSTGTTPAEDGVIIAVQSGSTTYYLRAATAWT